MNLTPSEKKIEVLRLGANQFKTETLARLEQLDSDYFNQFSSVEILGHFKVLNDWKSPESIFFSWEKLDASGFAITLIAQDVSGFFSVLSGLLVSHDFDIRLGKIFTIAADEKNPKAFLIDYLIIEKPNAEAIDELYRNQLGEELSALILLLRNKQLVELRKNLYLKIGAYFSRNFKNSNTEPLPIDIQIETDQETTCLIVQGTDRKGVLFSICNCLMLQEISIQKLLTENQGEHFTDRIFITDLQGNCIGDSNKLYQLKIAIILLERFTTTLPQAVDYAMALEGFNQFTQDLLNGSSAENISDFDNYLILATLSKVLSTGSYLWEEMRKIPIPDLIPLLQKIQDGEQKFELAEMKRELSQKISLGSDYTSQIEALNHFKDFHLFRFDIAYLARPYKSLQEFSNDISNLADLILENALWLAHAELVKKYGAPEEFNADLEKSTPTHFGLFAQGKLGGRELGYASDLEVQLLYQNTGETRHEHSSISNAEFFSLLVEEIRKIVVTKKDGIFELDLRLRPHGESGPLATRLDTWIEYYNENGQALDYERQALLKLRCVTSTPRFDEKVLSARDALIFGEVPVDIANSLKLHAQQSQLKAAKQNLKENKDSQQTWINAKYSSGGLVEIEYAVQFLQLKHGRKISSLREANTEKVLEILLAEALITPGEFETIYRGYIFLRRLINALRMLHGNARDLTLPPKSSTEFLFLARRMGFIPNSRYHESEQLDWELNQTFANVHSWFDQQFSLAHSDEKLIQKNSSSQSLSEIFLNPSATDFDLQAAFSQLGCDTVSEPKKWAQNLFSEVKAKGLLVSVLVISESKLRASPDSIGVLKYLGQFLSKLNDADYFLKQVLSEPHLIEFLIKIFGHSEYLSDLLLRHPEFIFELGNPSDLEKAKIYSEFKKELQNKTSKMISIDSQLNRIQKFRDFEYLRIGLRDIYLQKHLQKITSEISQLSNVILEAVFDLTLLLSPANKYRDYVSVIALGKLGGNELNYSSDIDIVFVAQSEFVESEALEDLESWAKTFISALNQSSFVNTTTDPVSETTASEIGSGNKLFRVDLQLRPYGSHSNLVLSDKQFKDYYQNAASGWELQAWLKARPILGNGDLGNGVVRTIQSITVNPENHLKIETSMRAVRQMGLNKLREENRLTSEVKLGPGGIRTIEFYVQYLQIKFAAKIPELISGNTLIVLGRLFKFKLISANYFERLSKSYVFLRRIEHILQLQGLQQRHELPATEIELTKLAKRMGFETHLGITALSQFKSHYKQHILTLLDLSSSLFGYSTNLPGAHEERG